MTRLSSRAYQQVNYPQMLRESLWIFVDLCGSLWIFVDLCGSLWIFVDICGYSIQSYLHAGRPTGTHFKEVRMIHANVTIWCQRPGARSRMMEDVRRRRPILCVHAAPWPWRPFGNAHAASLIWHVSYFNRRAAFLTGDQVNAHARNAALSDVHL